MRKNHKCKNPNGCTCESGGCTCEHDHDNGVMIIDMPPEEPITTMKVENNGYNPDRPYAIPIQDFAPFGDHPTAQPIIWPSNYVGNLDGHVDYMASRLPDTTRLLKYMGSNYTSSDAYVCTKDNHLGYGVSNPASGRFIYGMEFGGSDDVHPVDTVLTFTENNGLRHAGMNEAGELIDMGPVTNPIVIGPRSHPQAMLVPIHNMTAVAKAQDMLYNALMNHLEEQSEQPSPRYEETPKIELVVDSSCMHTLPMPNHIDEDKLPF